MSAEYIYYESIEDVPPHELVEPVRQSLQWLIKSGYLGGMAPLWAGELLKDLPGFREDGAKS